MYFDKEGLCVLLDALELIHSYSFMPDSLNCVRSSLALLLCGKGQELWFTVSIDDSHRSNTVGDRVMLISRP